jgi:RNA 2',3'-cyclic 3'-phosphodiesterase
MPRQFSIFDDAPDDGSDPAADERLSGIPDRRVNMGGTVGHDVFFALAAGTVGAGAIVDTGGRVLRQLGTSGKPVEAHRLHVSMYDVAHYVDRFAREDVSAAMRAADRLTLAAFDVVFDRVAKFGSGRTAFVFKAGPGEPLSALHDCRTALGQALADVGRRTTKAKPTPHMTFAYGEQEIPEMPIEPLRWRAESLVLIDSHVGGHRHEVLGSWPLRA